MLTAVLILSIVNFILLMILIYQMGSLKKKISVEHGSDQGGDDDNGGGPVKP